MSSSSSIGCGAGDHKVLPCTAIISKCGNLLFLHCSFIIPKQSLHYKGKVRSTWSTRSPFANGWDVQSISFSRLLTWHSEDVTKKKKNQLAVPNQVNQKHSVRHGIGGGVHNMVNELNIQHDSAAWGSKGVDFILFCFVFCFALFRYFFFGGEGFFHILGGRSSMIHSHTVVKWHR